LLQNAVVTVDAAVGLLFAIIGTVALAWTAVNFIYALLSCRWPEATGTVVVSDLQRSPNVEGGHTYRPEVSYRYTVNGEEFVASRTRFGDRLELGWSAPAVRIIRRYRVGTVVRVRYNPDDPGDAVLEPGVNGLLFASAAFGGVFTLIGIAALRSTP
jgi:hypothetical protein